MRTRPIRKVVAYAAAVVAVLGIVFGASACSSPEQAEPPAPVAPGQPGVPAAPQGAPDPPAAAAAGGTALTAAGQGAAALAALGGLGQAQGAAPSVRDLGAQLSTDGHALLDQLRVGAGGVLTAAPSAEQQAALADLRGRSGEQFDQAWLRAAMQAQMQARDAANAVLADGAASEEARGAAQDLLSRLDSLEAQLQAAAAPAGAETPRTVEAGSGGQAAGDVRPTALVIVGVGVLLLAGALWWRRRAA